MADQAVLRNAVLTILQVSTYSFQEHKKSFGLQVLDVKSGSSTTLYTDSSYSEPSWVSETDFVFIKAGEKGTTSLMLASSKTPGATCVTNLLPPLS